MSDSVHLNIIRAWKDEEYRASLPEEIRRRVPAPPADLLDLSEQELAEAAGGIVWTTPAVTAIVGSATVITGGAVGMGMVLKDAGKTTVPNRDENTN